MKLFCITALLGVVAQAAPVKQPNGYVAITLHHKFDEQDSIISPSLNNVRGAQALDPTTLTNHISHYSADITIGTPPQHLTVDVDTGSSDLWVLDSSTGENPSFDPSNSSSFNKLDQNFNINYLQGSADGEWGTDKVGIAGALLEDLQFGVVDSSGSAKGILGVGMIELESTDKKYINLPQMLVEQGAIYHNAYSIFLDSIESSSGSILFGGVQPSKYTGTLYTVPMLSNTTISIEVNEVIAGEDTAIAIPGGKFPALLDSGTSLTYLEDEVVAGIAQRLGAKYYPDKGAYYTDERSDEHTVTYEFSGHQLTVASTEVLIDGSIFGGGDAPGKYMMTIMPYSQASNYTILGDSFLRSVYAVFDLENLEISMAQSSYSKNESCIQVIRDTVPGAVRAPFYQEEDSIVYY